MMPWSNGKFLVWDATYIDTFCNPHIKPTTSREIGGAAAHVESAKAKKYACLDRAFLIQPSCSLSDLQCSCIHGPDSKFFRRDLSKHIQSAIGEASSFAYLLQRPLISGHPSGQHA